MIRGRLFRIEETAFLYIESFLLLCGRRSFFVVEVIYIAMYGILLRSLGLRSLCLQRGFLLNTSPLP